MCHSFFPTKCLSVQLEKCAMWWNWSRYTGEQEPNTLWGIGRISAWLMGEHVFASLCFMFPWNVNTPEMCKCRMPMNISFFVRLLVGCCAETGISPDHPINFQCRIFIWLDFKKFIHGPTIWYRLCAVVFRSQRRKPRKKLKGKTKCMHKQNRADCGQNSLPISLASSLCT